MSALLNLSIAANVAVIGASGGIGRALVAALIAQGDRVAVLDLPASLARHPQDCPEIPVDATSEASVAEAMAAVAAIVNLICLRMLQRTKEKDVSMRAATTFSFNDFIANGGIIIAGIIVMLTGANWPDLVVGIAVACIALYGGVQILRDAHHDIHDEEGTEHEGGDQFRL